MKAPRFCQPGLGTCLVANFLRDKFFLFRHLKVTESPTDWDILMEIISTNRILLPKQKMEKKPRRQAEAHEVSLKDFREQRITLRVTAGTPKKTQASYLASTPTYA